MIAAKAGSKMAPKFTLGMKAEIVEDTMYGMKGANTAMPTKRHSTRLSKLVDWRTSLGLGVSVKSAPLMPFDREIAPRVKTKKTASETAIAAALNDGW